MKFFNHIFSCLLASAITVGAVGCTDELPMNSGSGIPGKDLPADMEHAIIVPLAVSLGEIDASTRADESDLGTPQNGTSREHAIDFEIDKECFVIFFKDTMVNNKNVEKFVCISRLYTHPTLGSPSVPNDGFREYVVNTIAYLEAVADLGLAADYYLDENGNQLSEAAINKKIQPYLPTKVLVVLNGGRIYNKLHTELGIEYDLITGRPKITKKEYLDSDDFLDFVWLSQYSKEASNDKDQVIGINNEGHYTMTNSAYYGPDEEFIKDSVTGIWSLEEKHADSEEDYKLQTVRPLNTALILPAFASNIKPENTAAYVSVERMVAKFSAPKFHTEVIGSNKVFRPSQNAEPMFIYSWDSDGNLNSEKVNWRIHVLGWSINGREKGNYLFKHIRQGWEGPLEENGQRPGYKEDGYIQNWSPSGIFGWNNPAKKRSYWSIDPHYDDDASHYPWQYNAAMDRANISWFLKDKEKSDISLRYLSFNELLYWSEQPIYISENTFDPITFPANNTNVMDGRASYLVAPHLLVTAELYIENPDANDDDYMGQFKTVSNLYSDRFRRFYTSERDWFLMFVKEFNEALIAQERMTFRYYDWNTEVPGNEDAPIYRVSPSGNCAILFDCDVCEDPVFHGPQKDQLRQKFHLKPIEEVLDGLLELGLDVSMDANVKDGDGRLIPWLQGMVYRNKTNPSERLKVERPMTDSEKINDKIDLSQEVFVPVDEWTDAMRKSLAYEWFGAIDHYTNGYMYYAAEIPHHVASGGITYYGTVRNHWYTFTVTSINSIGNPVSNLSAPIIPAKFGYKDQIGVNVSILDDHTVSNSVILQ